MHLLSKCAPRVWINRTWTGPSHLSLHPHTPRYILTHTVQYMQYIIHHQICGRSFFIMQDAHKHSATNSLWSFEHGQYKMSWSFSSNVPFLSMLCAKEMRKRGKRKDVEVGKHSKQKQVKEPVPLPEPSPESNIPELPDDEEPKMRKIYARLLHKKVSPFNHLWIHYLIIIF